MQAAIGSTNPSFSRPDGVVERWVCYGTGGLAASQGTNTYSEVFLVSALPTTSCSAALQQKEEQKQPEEEPVVEEPEVEEDEVEVEEPEGETPAAPVVPPTTP